MILPIPSGSNDAGLLAEAGSAHTPRVSPRPPLLAAAAARPTPVTTAALPRRPINPNPKTEENG